MWTESLAASRMNLKDEEGRSGTSDRSRNSGLGVEGETSGLVRVAGGDSDGR